MTRRDFMKIAASGTLALAFHRLARGAAPLQRLSRAETPRRITVLGAGLAGLAAAYELNLAGHIVNVLEARAVPGGRVRTLHDAFDDGLHVELGGEQYYPVTPNYAAHYVKELGLDRASGGERGLSGVNYFGNTLIPQQSALSAPWPIALTDEEQTLGLRGMREKYLAPLVEELAGAIDTDGWTARAIERFDAMSIAEALRARGASPAAIELLRIQQRDYVGEGADRYSALELLGMVCNVSSAARYYDRAESFFSIRGGNDRLPRAFADRLGERITFNAVVHRIESDGRGVTVHYTQAGEARRIESDLVICAVPFTVLRAFEISPVFGAGKMRAMRELRSASVARTYLQCKRRAWRDDRLSGYASADLATTYYWESTSRQPGTRGVLQGWMGGAHARNFAVLAPEQKKAFAIDQAARVFPMMRDQVERFEWISWDSEPFSLGAFAWLRPGDGRELWPHLRKPEGRIHFAGEHTSTWFLRGSMQGALESGVRAAREASEAAASI